MLHLMRSITAPPDQALDVEAILTEVGGWVGELRCASMGQLVQGHVSMSQMHVLWLLQHHGEMSMSRLAELLGVSLSNATGIIDRMEEHGFIERDRVPDDRRVVIVRPAAGGLRPSPESEISKTGPDALSWSPPRVRAAWTGWPRSACGPLGAPLSVELESSPIHQHHFADTANCHPAPAPGQAERPMESFPGEGTQAPSIAEDPALGLSPSGPSSRSWARSCSGCSSARSTRPSSALPCRPSSPSSAASPCTSGRSRSTC